MTKLNACMLPGSSSYFSEEQQKNTIPAQRFTAGKFDQDFIPTIYHFKLCHQEYEETHSS